MIEDQLAHPVDADTETVLYVRNLCVSFATRRGQVTAVDGVSFALKKGEILGVVGESGCGKSVMARSVLGLLASPPAKVTADAITYRGRDGHAVDLAQLPRHGFRKYRGKEISMIFQEPMTSLNPVFTIGNQLMEPLLEHEAMSRAQARARAIELLEMVGIPSPHLRINEYPHQFSGGMRQRVMIAMAIACAPRILVADEPTTALDVTIQAQILGLLKRIGEQEKTSLIFISHDLGVISSLADRVIVMYLGKIVEQGPPEKLFSDPQHPYTQALIKSLPRLQSSRSEGLHPIMGSLPDPLDTPPGCRFHPRCPHAFDRCRRDAPALSRVDAGREAACWLRQ